MSILKSLLAYFLILQSVLACIIFPTYVFASAQDRLTISDPQFEIEVVAQGFDFPTSMAFLGAEDIIVLEKDSGTVKRVINGQILEESLIDVPVASKGERGLLGSAIIANERNPYPYVFLYYTESTTDKDGSDADIENQTLGNRLYRFEFTHDALMNPKLILDLPANVPAHTIPFHNGGKVLIGPDENVYLVMGDLESRKTQAQNIQGGPEPDGTGVIYRLTQDGKSAENNPLGDTHPANKYYAYGIRNSFGMDFDPMTGSLWNTENGPTYGDEINLVEPGFNSGSLEVHGMSSADKNFDLDKLVDFDGKGKYSDPEFVWQIPIGVTALQFLDSDKYGEEYENDMFVGDITHGNIYHFDLNGNRTELSLPSQLEDKVANNLLEAKDVIFGQGFGGITDMVVGPDGYLYVLAINRFREDNAGTIYRIVPI